MKLAARRDDYGMLMIKPVTDFELWQSGLELSAGRKLIVALKIFFNKKRQAVWCNKNKTIREVLKLKTGVMATPK